MAKNEGITRREAVKIAGVATAAVAVVAKAQGAPFIQTVKAANNQMQYGVIGTGGRGSYLLKHLTKIDNGRCVAVCDVNQTALDKAGQITGTNPAKFKDYRELLSQKNVDAVIVAVPLYLHFPVTKDALQAGKHVLCEKSLVFKPEEVHALRALVRRAPQAGHAGWLAAPLQRVLSDRAADDRQGHARATLPTCTRSGIAIRAGS